MRESSRETGSGPTCAARLLEKVLQASLDLEGATPGGRGPMLPEPPHDEDHILEC